MTFETVRFGVLRCFLGALSLIGVVLVIAITLIEVKRTGKRHLISSSATATQMADSLHSAGFVIEYVLAVSTGLLSMVFGSLYVQFT